MFEFDSMEERLARAHHRWKVDRLGLQWCPDCGLVKGADEEDGYCLPKILVEAAGARADAKKARKMAQQSYRRCPCPHSRGRNER